MIGDVGAVLWKELRELPHALGGRRGGLAGVLLSIVLVGVMIPLDEGPDFLSGWQPVFFASLWALVTVTAVVADSFAGERERHTLETLLASRLRDGAILVGKLLAAVLYGVALSVALLAVAFATVNLRFRADGPHLYPAPVAAAALGLALLGAGLAGSAGVLVSLRAATVKQAQQILMTALMLLFLVPFFGLRALPAAWKARLFGWLAGASPAEVLAAVAAVLLALDLALLAAARARFRRARLLLD